ncbi:dipeptidase [Alicyclobacillus herbarius]|uniref:dipeptidase n=1 Tax=Alicyclobacillus herbarius TaxID=122960 RepID=UPI00316ABDEC
MSNQGEGRTKRLTPVAIADAHVDVLWRMDEERHPFYGDSPLMASYQKMQEAHVRTQVFALFTSPRRSSGTQLEQVLRCLDRFYHDVVRPGSVRMVVDAKGLSAAHQQGEVAAVLSLEGAGCLHGQVSLLRVLHRLGVRGVGLTWNDANEFADGCLEDRNAGLTRSGRELVRELARLGMWLDLAHLGDGSTADALRCSDGPVMASHANARQVHPHPRNLPDAVIREIVQRDGWIGLTFEGSFVSEREHLSMDAVLEHVDYMLNLGAEDHLGFGSDFDGTSHPIPGLADMGDYPALARKLRERYGEALTRKLMAENLERFLLQVLS